MVRDDFLRTRRRSEALFDLVAPEAYLARPIPLRQPIVFYEGHIAAFSVNTLLKKALGRPGIDARLEALFARGIDPADEASAARSAAQAWPSREEVRRYAERADAAILEALGSLSLEADGERGGRLRQAVYTTLEHELMHQETLLYILHRLPYEQKRRPPDAHPVLGDGPGAAAPVRVPAGTATLGTGLVRVAFGWDNEFPEHEIEVGEFEIDAYDVTNGDYLAFAESGGYQDRRLWDAEAWRWIEATGRRHPLFWERREGWWYWRGMFEPIPLPLGWPVYVSHAEATAYARWKGKRLPTEAEFHRAAYGSPSGPERPYPWGEAPPDATRGNFDFHHFDPAPAGSYPAGQSASGVHDLVGNGWEWTGTVFDGFPGFRPMWAYPEYSADFFDGEHYVMKGASPATARELLRRSFRNWFRPRYPYVYATFRCVTSGAGASGAGRG